MKELIAPTAVLAIIKPPRTALTNKVIGKNSPAAPATPPNSTPQPKPFQKLSPPKAESFNSSENGNKKGSGEKSPSQS
jgi:hypothetical protein